ncbi:hypothetical protein DIPPA_27683 [Diplonema papillatum]|nr:hypothetical protein DIPPA_27683 [Diplonema papillatum]
MACIANLFRSEESVLRGAYAGKTVVVTGAGRGIGREVSVLLAKSGAARLILCSRTEGPLRETAALCNGAAAGRRDLAVTADVTNERTVHAWASEFTR